MEGDRGQRDKIEGEREGKRDIRWRERERTEI